MKFGEQLRRLREAKEMTRESLSEASGVAFGTIHGYEIGRRSPSFANVLALARALGVDCTAFSECTDLEKSEPEAAPKTKPPAPGKKGGRK